MADITIVFSVKNDAVNLRNALPLVSGLGNIVVVDSASTDATSCVAAEHGATLIQFNWNGLFPKKRNWVLRNFSFQTEWVLFLDADEFVSTTFVEEVRGAIESTSHVGFWLRYDNYFMGQRLRYGDPMRKLALFRVDAGEFEIIEEDNWSHLDMEVHEHPVLNGSIGEIKAPIQHNDFRGLKHYIAKHNEYSSWETARYLRLCANNTSNSQSCGWRDVASLECVEASSASRLSTISKKLSIQSNLEWKGLTERQKKKYRNLAKWWFAPAYFILAYIFKKGFLDGKAGLHFALMKTIYFYQIKLKIHEYDTCRERPLNNPTSIKSA